MKADRVDHIVLTVRNVDATVEFYRRALGAELIENGGGRVALRFGDQKMNLHEAGTEYGPHAARPTPGSADICLVSASSVEEIHQHLEAHGVGIELGPVERSGALGPMKSFYVRDPDGNLVEISTYAAPPA